MKFAKKEVNEKLGSSAARLVNIRQTKGSEPEMQPIKNLLDCGCFANDDERKRLSGFFGPESQSRGSNEIKSACFDHNAERTHVLHLLGTTNR